MRQGWAGDLEQGDCYCCGGDGRGGVGVGVGIVVVVVDIDDCGDEVEGYG